MVLTPDNYKSFAESNLLRYPIFQEEFETTLKIPTSVNKNITKYKNGTKGSNVRILINDTVIFFNYFNRSAAVDLYLYLVGEKNSMQAKSVIKLLGIWCGEYDEDFLEHMKREIDL